MIKPICFLVRYRTQVVESKIAHGRGSFGEIERIRLARRMIDNRQGLDSIERNARVQAQIIEDLLDMSRIISGKCSLDLA